MQELFGNLWNLQWQQVVMWGIGGLLIWLAIKKEMEPSLLLPMGFGAILVNLPLSGAVTQVLSTGTEVGPLDVLFDAGIANELFPLLLFVGIGAMIDFTPLLSNPKLMIFGAAAQFGIFFTLGAATLMGFELKDAASIAVIGAADGPTSIFVANFLESNYLGAIIVAAYSYMALVPIIQPPVIRLVTTKKERLIRMPYAEKQVSKTAKILFPIIITMVAGLFVPRSVALVGFLMFGNLIRECGVLDSLSETAQKVLANLITLLLGLTVASKMQAEYFLNRQTLMILALGLVPLCSIPSAACWWPRYITCLPNKKSTHDRCSGHFGIPDVGPCGEQDGPAGRQPELFADARRWGECIRSDRVRDCGRYDSDIVCLRCI